MHSITSTLVFEHFTGNMVNVSIFHSTIIRKLIKRKFPSSSKVSELKIKKMFCVLYHEYSG